MENKTAAPLDIKYDQANDRITIEGINYSGELFRSFGAGGLALEIPFKIVKREDGMIHLQTIASEEKVAEVLAPYREEITELKGVLSRIRATLVVPEGKSVLDWAELVTRLQALLLRSVTRCAGVGSPVLCQCSTALKKYEEAQKTNG